VKIKMLIPIAGTFHGVHGVRRGDVVEVDDVFGAKYCALHYAEPVVDRKEERAVAPVGEVRSAPDPVVEIPDAEPEPEAPKPGARPTRK
jgi:hypothetical protein